MKQAIIVWSFRQNIFLGCYPEKTSKIGRAVDIVDGDNMLSDNTGQNIDIEGLEGGKWHPLANFTSLQHRDNRSFVQIKTYPIPDLDCKYAWFIHPNANVRNEHKLKAVSRHKISVVLS